MVERPPLPQAMRTRAQVIWEQFRKHRLAVWGGRILLVMYTMAIFAGFFSPYDPNYYETSPPSANHSPSRIHFRDEQGRLTRPFVHATRRSIDEVTLQPKYLEDLAQGKFYIRFLVRSDSPYTILRIFKTNLRLFGVDAPARVFLMGSDNFGRDLWSRLVYGGQVSLTIGILSAFISFVLGITLGGMAGYFSGRPFPLGVPFVSLEYRRLLGRKPFLAISIAVLTAVFWLGMASAIGYLAWKFWQVTPKSGMLDWIIGIGIGVLALAGIAFCLRGAIAQQARIDADNLVMRLVEIIGAIPGLFLLISLRAAFPLSMDALLTFYLVVSLLGFIGWGGIARAIRGIVLTIREHDYVQAARAIGSSDSRIVGRHILPATSTFVIVSLSLAIPGFILGESGLSFLGLGIREPYTSWGLLLSAAQDGGFASISDRPWVLWPGFFIFLAVISWNFLGDGLRDAFDPRKRQ